LNWIGMDKARTVDAAFWSFQPIRNGGVSAFMGSFFFAETDLNSVSIVHEAVHAGKWYLQLTGDIPNLGETLNQTPEENKREERLAVVISTMSDQLHLKLFPERENNKDGVK